MPRNPDKKQCNKPNCRNYAMHGHHLCRVHLNHLLPTSEQGTSSKESNPLSHGFYSRHYTIQELSDLLDETEIPALDEEITAARIAIRRLLSYLGENDPVPDRDFQAAIALVFTGASTIGRLIRHQQVISGESAAVTLGALMFIPE